MELKAENWIKQIAVWNTLLELYLTLPAAEVADASERSSLWFIFLICRSNNTIVNMYVRGSGYLLFGSETQWYACPDFLTISERVL